MRKVIQISAISGTLNLAGALFALADDGSIWSFSLEGPDAPTWVLMPRIPTEQSVATK
jgi:hypothetical protein